MEETINKEKNNKSLTTKVYMLIESIIFIIIGIVCLVFNWEEGLRHSLYLILGLVFTIIGFSNIVLNLLPLFFMKGKKDAIRETMRLNFRYDQIAFSAFQLAFGITFLVIYAQNNVAVFDTIATFIAIFLSTLLLVGGLAFLVISICFGYSKLYGKTIQITGIILGIVLLALGIVVAVFINRAEIMERVTLIILGLVFLLLGIAILIDAIKAFKKKKTTTTAVIESADVQEVITPEIENKDIKE